MDTGNVNYGDAEMNQNDLQKKYLYDSNSGVFARLKDGQIAGSKSVDGYWVMRINNRQYKAHRLAWLYVFGTMPINNIDHINRNRLDNRICNLRDVDNTVNARNKVVKHGAQKVGARHVTYSKRTNRWLVRFRVGRKEIYYQSFLSQADAETEAKRLKPFFHPEAG